MTTLMLSLVFSLPNHRRVLPVNNTFTLGQANVDILLGSWTDEGLVTSTSLSNNYNVSIQLPSEYLLTMIIKGHRSQVRTWFATFS
jgi:hypothetical protein